MIVFISLNLYRYLTFLFNNKGIKPKKSHFCIAVRSPPQPPIAHQPYLPVPWTLQAVPVPSEKEWVKPTTLNFRMWQEGGIK